MVELAAASPSLCRAKTADNDQFPDYFRNLDRAPSAFDTPQMVSVAGQYHTGAPNGFVTYD